MTMVARFLPQYPKRIQVTDGLTKTEANGVLTLGFDYENSEFGAELQQAVDTTAANAAATAADRVQTGLDVEAANEAAGIATSAVSIFKTKTAAESAHPIAAYDYIKTWGRSALADGGEALAKNNGTTTGDIVLTLDDGVTNVGFDVQRSADGYRPQQFAVIGDVDDRIAFQAALDKLQDGDTFVFPGWATATIVNGVGTGATLVDQRADAVANGGLKALTCDKNNITVVIDGTVKGTSGLDDLFRFTGNNVRVTGKGLIRSTSGVWLDTNPAPLSPEEKPLQQWYPSLIAFEGDDSGVEGPLTFRDPTTVSVRLRGERGFARCGVKFLGGPTTYRPNGGVGTVLFHVYAGDPDTLKQDHKVHDVWFLPGADGGRVYSNIFGTSGNSSYRGNHHRSCWENGIYNYGAGVTMQGEVMDGVTVGIQNEAFDAVINGVRIFALTGGILAESATRLTVEACSVRAGTSGIAVRTRQDAAEETVTNDIRIANNYAEVYGDVGSQQSPIDVSLNNILVGLEVLGNQTLGGGGDTNTYAGIRVIGSTNYQAIDVNVAENQCRNANGAGIYVARCIDPKVKSNAITNANGNAGDGESAILAAACTGGTFEKNTATDTRDTKLTKRILTAQGSDSNSAIRALNNTGMNLDPTSTALAVVPTDASSEARGNSRNGAPTRGRFTVTNSVSDSVTAPGVISGATITLTPANPNADALQQSSKRIYVSSVSNGSFAWSTADSSSTGSTAADYLWEAMQ